MAQQLTGVQPSRVGGALAAAIGGDDPPTEADASKLPVTRCVLVVGA